MKRLGLLACLALFGCDEMQLAGPGGNSSFQEFMVIGSNMSFEQCRARGGLIIRDAGSPMTACDPTVLGKVVPLDEFDHPSVNAAAAAAEG
jgi:hypothetical protein